MMVLVIRNVALEGYKYIRRSGKIVCVFMCKVDIDSWPSYYFNGSYYIYIYICMRSESEVKFNDSMTPTRI